MQHLNIGVWMNIFLLVRIAIGGHTVVLLNFFLGWPVDAKYVNFSEQCIKYFKWHSMVYIVQSFCRHEEVFYLIMAYNETVSELLIIYYLITALNGTLYLWIVVLDRTLYNSLIVAYKGIVYSFNESNV